MLFWCFSWSMGSTFSSFVTPLQRNAPFFGATSPQRGVKNAKMWFSYCTRSKKKCASHGAWETYFWVLQPLSINMHILGSKRPIQAGAGRRRIPFWDLEGAVGPPVVAPGVKITWVYITNSLKSKLSCLTHWNLANSRELVNSKVNKSRLTNQ